ncbi:hypothetical protein DTO164E3_8114 [Paecilomyces variotii]|nr:hypothetical protein DTO164E3_8114 [Paecilomyces variotii]
MTGSFLESMTAPGEVPSLVYSPSSLLTPSDSNGSILLSAYSSSLRICRSTLFGLLNYCQAQGAYSINCRERTDLHRA